MSGHKKLIAEKLAEEDEERKVKGEAKKEKHLVFDVDTYLYILPLGFLHQSCVSFFPTIFYESNGCNLFPC